MWTVQNFFGGTLEETRIYIASISTVHTIMQMFAIILLFANPKCARFYIDHYQLVSAVEADKRTYVLIAFLTGYLILNFIAMIFSLVFIISKKNWSTLCWVVFHGILVITYLLSVVGCVTYLGYNFKWAPSGISTLLSATAMTNGFYIFLWYAVFYELATGK